MSRAVMVPGGRDVRAALDGLADDALGCVVACPPHPQAGATRSNPVLKALGDALERTGVATLRFDYAPWDEGAGEVTDAVQAVEWAEDRFDRVGFSAIRSGRQSRSPLQL